MPQQRVHAIVLRYANYRESSRMLTLFSLELGRISVAARGCRSPRSQLRPACEVLTFSEWILHTNRDRHTAREASVVDPFFDLREDLERLSVAMHLRDLTEAVLEEGTAQPALFSLLIRSLGLLCHEKLDPKLVQRFFEVHLLAQTGLMPEVSRCSVCGEPLHAPCYFSEEDGGALCGRCHARRPRGREVLPGTLATLGQLMRADTELLPMMHISTVVFEELERFWMHYLNHQLDRTFHAADFGKGLL